MFEFSFEPTIHTFGQRQLRKPIFIDGFLVSDGTSQSAVDSKVCLVMQALSPEASHAINDETSSEGHDG